MEEVELGERKSRRMELVAEDEPSSPFPLRIVGVCRNLKVAAGLSQPTDFVGRCDVRGRRSPRSTKRGKPKAAWHLCASINSRGRSRHLPGCRDKRK
jgi:hypothetical protein